MDSIQRYDSSDRKFYMFKNPNPFRLNPHLLYVGELKSSMGRCESEHTHDFCEIMFVSDGYGFVTVNGDRREIKRGDIIIYNSGVSHFEESCSEGSIEMFFMAFDSLEISDLDKNCLLPPNYSFIYTADDYFDTFFNFFKQMVAEFKEQHEFYMEMSQNISHSILMYILRIINTKESQPIPILPHNDNVINALAFIKSNFRENLTLDEIAKNCYVDKYYLAHQFTKYKGMSIGKYILNLRINEAMRMLRETQFSVNEISQMIGFYDISYFCRVFKKVVLLTPLQYRKQETGALQSGSVKI